MEQNKIPVNSYQTSTPSMQNFKETNDQNVDYSKKEKILIILAGIFTLLPVYLPIVIIIDRIFLYSETPEWLYPVLSYLPKIIGIVIYFISKNKNIKYGMLIGMVFSLFIGMITYGNMLNTETRGIDGIGEALVNGFIINVSNIVFYILAIILFVLCSKSFIFKIQILLPVLAFSLSIIYIPAYFANKFYEDEKISNHTDLKTVNDFKNELIKRDLYTEYGKLISINNSGKHLISFVNNSSNSEPAYIYYGYESEYSPDDYYWIIYYNNGHIYASLSYFISGDESPDYTYDHYYRKGKIFTEDENIYVYNEYTDHYLKVSTKKSAPCAWLYNDFFSMDSGDRLTIPNISYSDDDYDNCKGYETVDFIDRDTLDEYSKKDIYSE